MRKTAFLVCVLSWNVMAANFGSHGNDGRPGENGLSGMDGVDANFAATGQYENLNLAGTDGRDARAGENGQNAWGCSQPMNVSYNLNGANGGDGGRGGEGGRGGNGGDVTVYFDDINNLKKIYLRSTPGRGGYGAYGGRAGNGCYCSVPQWTVTNGTETKTYYCQNGQNGNQGYSGNSGSRGSYGSLTLISQLQAVGGQVTYVKIPVEQLLAKPYEVYENQWANRSGARLLFAPGSDITDSYKIFLGTLRKTYTFTWESPRPMSDFAGQFVSLHLSGGKTYLDSSQNLWFSGTATELSSNHTQFAVQTVLLDKEVANLKAGKITGTDTATELPIDDAASVSKLVQNKVTLKYFTQKGAYFLRWQGTVPPEALSVVDNRLTIAIGKLPIKAEYLATGKKAMVQVWVTRSLGSRSKQKSFQLKQTLGQ